MKRKEDTPDEQQERIDMIMESMKTWGKDNSHKYGSSYQGQGKQGQGKQGLTPYVMLLIANLAILISVLFLR